MPDRGSAPAGVPVVDSGAYEFQGRTCFGDIDGDGAVALADLSVLLGHYGMSSGATYVEGDLNADQAVGLDDLSLLLGVYGSSCE